jgi:adenine-specific DNA-methyltransferase
MDLSKKYSHLAFVSFVRNFLPQSFTPEKQDVTDDVTAHYKLKKSKKITFLGNDDSLDLGVFEIEHDRENDPRVTLSRESFRAISAFGFTKGLCVFISPNSPNWRLSLVTVESKISTQKGRLIKEYSNPRRLSFFLGESAKTATPKKALEKKVVDFDDLLQRFSIEVVNKTFYNDISSKFLELAGGERAVGKEKKETKATLKMPSTIDHEVLKQFAVRLIGRLVFCWFLKKKGLIPSELLNSEDAKNTYYHNVIEPLFFQVLNKPFNKRDSFYQKSPWNKIPFLNGGLFEPKNKDHYIFDEATGLSKHISALVVPDAWLKSFIQILETYNFTVDENNPIDIDLSIDPEMLGRIFENLLAELNPETGETARKETGSFYTPRQIVDYMVSSSIKLYLKEKTNIKEKQLESLLDYDHEENPLTDDETDKVISALHSLKVLDPACGSGAFPMGILQHVLLILSKVDPHSDKWLEKRLEGIDDPMLQDQIRKNLLAKNVDYIHKLGIIRESIYGVDIQPIAVEIARLRVFLSLIVDEDIHENQENRGIEPLPNLEFKFVVADTLIHLPGPKEKESFSLGEDLHYLPRMRNLIKNYFSCADLVKKQKIKNDFTTMQNRVFNKRLDLFSSDTQTAAIAIWEPFTENCAAWFDQTWMFGIDKGFDIIIANPPYIQLQKIKNTSVKLKKEGYKSYAATGDIYSLFYERAIELLSKEGVLSYITSNKWMRANYGKTLRQLFLDKTNIDTLIDFGDQQLFSNATTYTNILILQPKTKKKQKTIACDLSKSLNPSISIKDNLVNNLKYVGEFDNERFLIIRKEEFELKKKIEQKGTPLKDWDIEINYGIKTGLNEAFIIDTETKERLCKQDPKSAQIIKPILRGKDIKRYQAQWAGLWLIATLPACKIDIKKYPAVKKYLESFGKRLHQTGEIAGKDEFGNTIKSRKKTGNKWFETQDQIAYYKEFEKEKIIYPNMSKFLPFFLDNTGAFTNQKCFIITGTSLKYITTWLNSSLFEYLARFWFPMLMGDTYEPSKVFFENVPIPQIPKTQQKPYEKLVDQIQKQKKQGKDTKPLEKQINQMVYNLYQLTPQEIKLIETKK